MLATVLALMAQPLPEAARAAPPVVLRERIYSPREAITAAADAEGQPVTGIFHMQVLNTGWDRGRLFLNSERDYRDQRALSIAISPEVAEALADRFNDHPEAVLRGRNIQVRGFAVRTRINFTSYGHQTGLYYYQTHVPVTNADQIIVVD